MAYFPSVALVYVMVGTQGGIGYGLASVYGPLPAEIFRGRFFATIFGAIGLISMLGAGVGPWAAGWVHDLTGSYAPAFWMALVLCFAGIACIWRATLPGPAA
jgi:nitrate/nitrite transporter NarK